MSLLSMKHICKSFYGVPVLKNAELTVEYGEVHALLGENGAGKSTLMNILTGVVQRDSGEITFEGQSLKQIGIRRTEQLGIAFVHQELNLFNDLRVYENVFLLREYTTPGGMLDIKRMKKETGRLFRELGIDIDPEERVENLKTSQKQLLEISKALFFDAKLLILDEPTTSLNNEEIAYLFKIIKKLKKKGASFIFISHKMPEVFEVADRYTVLRNGEFVCSGMIAETTSEKVTKRMVGEGYSEREIYEKRVPGEIILELKNFTGHGFHDVNLTIRRGSIIGLTGLQGSGSSELLQGMFGAAPVEGGAMSLKGKKQKIRCIHDAMKAGIGMVASNRKENAVIPDMNLLDNFCLAEHTLSAWQFAIPFKKERQRYEVYKKMLSIKANSEKDNITSLSGGNQQKVFLARCLNTGADILLLDNPTQGIDVGSKAEIYQLILKLAKEGKTILINTLEIPEIKKVADYCAVFYEGTIIKILEHEKIDETSVMLYATNALPEEERL